MVGLRVRLKERTCVDVFFFLFVCFCPGHFLTDSKGCLRMRNHFLMTAALQPVKGPQNNTVQCKGALLIFILPLDEKRSYHF